MANFGRIVPSVRAGDTSSGIGEKQQRPKSAFPLRGDIIAALAELVGMTVFIFMALSGVQAALNAQYGPGQKVNLAAAGPTFSQIQSVAFSFGSSIAVGMFICAPLSGAALNPAVLLSLLLVGNVPWFRGLLLFIAQIVGAILGAYFSNWVTANDLLGYNQVAPGFNNAQALFAEALMTSCLCLVVLFIIVENNVLVTYSPFVVGLTIFMCHMIGTPIDGTSINPARSFGPAIVTGRWTSQWIFWIGPFVGAIFAVIIYMFFKSLKWEEQSPNERDAFTTALETGMIDDRSREPHHMVRVPNDGPVPA